MARSETQPFTIRAHHLIQDTRWFTTAMYTSHHPMSQDFVEGQVAQETFLLLDNNLRGFDSEEEFLSYRRDVLGDNPEQRAPERIKQMTEYVLSFARLNDDDPVHLITGRDAICAACAIGQHCDAPESKIGESSAMDDFVEIAIKLGMKANQDFSIIKSGDLNLRLETTKRTASQVMSSLRAQSSYFG